MKLILFDIDGTLLLTRGVGRRALEAALERVIGGALSSDGVTFSGKTDPQILREILVLNGHDGGRLAAEMQDVMAAYCDFMRDLLCPGRIEVLPGVPELIRELDGAPDVQLGLLTGNVESMARLKLEMAELAHYFPFGAYGSDDEDRYRLPDLALTRAEKYTGRAFEGSDVIIVGDTEHDIACGRGIGAFSVGVCTGRFSREDLTVHRPHVLLDDLTDIRTFRTQVLGTS